MSLALLLPLLPFVAAGAGLAAGRRLPRAVPPLAVGGAAAALALALVLVLQWDWQDGSGTEETLLTRIVTGGPEIAVGARVDGLTLVVAVMVAAVALAVQVYSVGYLRGDPRFSSYAAFVSLFTAAMLLVVVSADLLVLLVGWEVMGVCSYFLIGHHWEQEGSQRAAVKAFLVTRFGDVLFLFGIFAVGVGADSFRIADVVELDPNSTAARVGALLLLGGVLGKSAQFPLHVWLPDAMAGPTPISALIHAATMVAAGVFLVARLWGLYDGQPVALAVLAVVSAVTMLGGALAALAQDDIKRVLAYSTLSQLAYMFAGLAVGAPVVAVFHLLTHAAFKALLFLAAGAVIHGVGSSLMADMGGLRRRLPVTFVAMTIGLAALVGVPPLSGFFSKEAVLAAAEEAARGAGAADAAAPWAGWLVLLTGLLTVAATAAYATRLWLRTFFGRSRAPAGSHPHEAPPVMLWPLVALAVPTLLLGLVGLRGTWLPRWLLSTALGGDGWSSFVVPGEDIVPGVRLGVGGGLETAGLVPHVVTGLLSTALVAAGAAIAYLLWRADPAADPALRLGQLHRVLAAGFGVDALYSRVVVAPVRAAARGVRWADRDVVDAYVRGSATGARWLGGGLRLTQRGNVQSYLTGLLAGVLLLVAGVVVLT